MTTTIEHWYGDEQIELEITFTVESNGIGHYDYAGAIGYDSSNYPDIDIIESDHIEFNKELENNYDKMVDEITRLHEDELLEYYYNI